MSALPSEGPTFSSFGTLPWFAPPWIAPPWIAPPRLAPSWLLKFVSLVLERSVAARRCSCSWFEPLHRCLVTPVGEGFANDILGTGVHYQHKHTPVPLDGVGDLDVEDVDP